MKTEIPLIHVGKGGLSDNLFTEIKTQLDKHGRVKVKILPSARNIDGKKKMAQEISEKTKSRLVGLRGYTIILSKK